MNTSFSGSGPQEPNGSSGFHGSSGSPEPADSGRHPDASAPTADLFDRYLAGDASLEEIAEVKQWLANFPDHSEAVLSLRTMWAGQQVPSWYAQERWQAIAENLPDRVDAVLPSRSGSIWSHIKQTHAFIAIASAFILAAVGIAGWQITARSTTIAGIQSTQASLYSTPNGERATITLPDGSRVTLNVGSRLEVPSTFGAGTRTVRLSGEAVFHVAHAQGTPFVVVAGPSTTRVLGTRFLVRHYATDSSAIILVESGRVAVGETVLGAQQQASISTSRMVTMHPLESERLRFVDGVLEFDGASLVAIIPDLNRWYNADIRLGDQELASRIVVGGFPSGSLTDLVSALEWAFNVRVVRNGQILTLYSGTE